MVKIGEKLKTLRTEQHLTQKDLAERLNVSPQAVSRWENDEVEPSLETLGQLASIFSVSVDELFGKETPAKPAPEVRYVEAQSRPVLAVCEVCNKPLYAASDIIRESKSVGRTTEKRVICRCCKERERLSRLGAASCELNKKWKRAWIWSPIASLALLILFIFAAVYREFTPDTLITGVILSLLLGAFLVCVFLDNTFVGEMWASVASWGFVRMPGIIFSLDFDGIVFLIAAKILFSILSFLLALGAAALATALGLLLGIFTMPFSIRIHLRNVRENLDGMASCRATLAGLSKERCV